MPRLCLYAETFVRQLMNDMNLENRVLTDRNAERKEGNRKYA